MTSTPTRRQRRTLLVYRDPRLLTEMERSGFTQGPIGLVVELSERSRLGRGDGRQPRVLRQPMVCAQAAHNPPTEVLAVVERWTANVLGEVVFVCHVDDVALFLPHLRDVDSLRLLWLPADPACTRLEALARRIELDPFGVMFDAETLQLADPVGIASADDWRRAETCPILARFAVEVREDDTDLIWDGPGRMTLPDAHCWATLAGS